MRYRLLIAMFFALSTTTFSETLSSPIYTSSCSSPGQAPVAGTAASCIATDSHGITYSRASSNASLTLTNNGGVLTGEGSAAAGSFDVPGNAFVQQTSASSSVSLNQ